MAYDAVLIPQSMASGQDARSRALSLVDLAEECMGVDRSKGERAYVRPAKPGTSEKVFATRCPEDTILFPHDHELSGHSRYLWRDRGDGVELGMLLATEDDARMRLLETPKEVLQAEIQRLRAENARLKAGAPRGAEVLNPPGWSDPDSHD